MYIIAYSAHGDFGMYNIHETQTKVVSVDNLETLGVYVTT